MQRKATALVAQGQPLACRGTQEWDDRSVPGHEKDLELARACERGDETAWDRFIAEYRPILYRSADAIDPSGGAREVADSLYAELYGLKESDGKRKSLFAYFQGRSSLATWLRAILAQRYVDRIRGTRRLEELADDHVARVDHRHPWITAAMPRQWTRRWRR